MRAFSMNTCMLDKCQCGHDENEHEIPIILDGKVCEMPCYRCPCMDFTLSYSGNRVMLIKDTLAS